MQSELALMGGSTAVSADAAQQEEMFHWPIITREDEDAVLSIMREGSMSATNITMQFEEAFAKWQGRRYALGYCNGTAALQAAMFGCGLGVGDEMICPSLTYWASVSQIFPLGATVVFADIDPESLCIDPADIERCITDRTKAIMVVHYLAHPADMDGIMAVARRHNLKVIEDVSHAQGGYYKGKKLGTFGDVAAMSVMSGKSLALGEAGMLVTDDLEIYERAIAFGHYDRFNDSIQTPYLKEATGVPLGGVKGRMNQMCSAIGLIQLKYYDLRIAEIRKAMNYFWDRLEDAAGVHAHRVDEKEGSNMAGWYAPHGLYDADALGGLSVTRFCQALRAEGVEAAWPGCNTALHTHALFNTFDVYGHGKPTRIANATRDVRIFDKALPHTEAAGARSYSIPWFKHFRPEIIDQYVAAFCKVSENYRALLADDPGNPSNIGRWYFYRGKDDK